jgi:5-methylthioadenosine/S-adenosylhomocysteine deaminase
MDARPVTDSRVADFAVRARWILPVDPPGSVLEQHAVIVRGGRIVAVTADDEVPHWSVGEILERPRHALIPGLVNTHTHAAMTLLRNAACGLPLDDWLRQRIWPLEARLVDERFVEDGTTLAIAEMLLAGVTCFADMYFHPDVAARVAAHHGMRACIGLPVLETPSSWAADLDEYLDRGLRLRDAYRDDPLVDTLFVLHSPISTSDAALARVRTLADQLQAPVMTHLLESPTDRGREEHKHGRGPLQRLAAAGLVNDLLIAVHGVHLNTAEVEQLSEAGSTVVHCPASNLKLAAGIAPLHQLRCAGVRVALGTDGAASNDALDVLGEARLAALLAAGTTGEAGALPPHEALHLATLAGAQSLGLGEITGSITPGKWADLVALRLDAPGVQPLHDIAAAIIHSAGRDAVCDTWVAGRRLVADGCLTRLSARDLAGRAGAWRPRVVAAMQAIAGQ